MENNLFFGIFNCVEIMGAGGGGESLPFLCVIQFAAGIAPRNTSIGHFADLCKLHWVILNVVSLISVKYFIHHFCVTAGFQYTSNQYWRSQ